MLYNRIPNSKLGRRRLLTMSATSVRIFGCPTCGFRVDTNERSCPRCGNEFQDDTKFECPFCGDLVRSGLDECPVCGALVGAKDHRCGECGTVFDAEAESAARTEEAESRLEEIKSLTGPSET